MGCVEHIRERRLRRQSQAQVALVLAGSFGVHRTVEQRVDAQHAVLQIRIQRRRLPACEAITHQPLRHPNLVSGRAILGPREFRAGRVLQFREPAPASKVVKIAPYHERPLVFDLRRRLDRSGRTCCGKCCARGTSRRNTTRRSPRQRRYCIKLAATGFAPFEKLAADRACNFRRLRCSIRDAIRHDRHAGGRQDQSAHHRSLSSSVSLRAVNFTVARRSARLPALAAMTSVNSPKVSGSSMSA